MSKIDEQDEERQAGGQARKPADVQDVLRGQISADAQQQAADEGERNAGEVADRRRTEGLDHQERQADGVEPDERQDQHAGHGGEGGADRPGDAAHPHRVDGLHRHQVGVVDDGAHRQTGPGEAEKDVQQRHAHDPDDRDPQLRVENVDAPEPEALERPRQELLDPNGVRSVLDRAEALHEQDQPDGADDLRGRPLGGEPAGDLLHAETHDRAGDEDRQEEGDLPVQTLVDVKKVEEVGSCRGDRAVAEVEDPGRLVRQYEPGARQSVDGAGRDTANDEWQKVVQRPAPLTNVRSPASGSSTLAA